jgi:hypothetical protein
LAPLLLLLLHLGNTVDDFHVCDRVQNATVVPGSDPCTNSSENHTDSDSQQQLAWERAFAFGSACFRIAFLTGFNPAVLGELSASESSPCGALPEEVLDGAGLSDKAAEALAFFCFCALGVDSFMAAALLTAASFAGDFFTRFLDLLLCGATFAASSAGTSSGHVVGEDANPA